MKKKTILMVMLLMCCLAGTAYAADVTVTVDGKELAQKGVIVDGRTMVPIRDIAEAMGLDVFFDDRTGRVELKRNGLFVGDMVEESYSVATWKPNKDGQLERDVHYFDSDVPMQNIGGKSMMPLKVAAEMLDADISWDGTSYTASVTQKPKSTVTAGGKIDLMGGLNKHDRGEYGRPMSEMGFEVTSLVAEPKDNGSWKIRCEYANRSDRTMPAAIYIVAFSKESGKLIESSPRLYREAWEMEGSWVQVATLYHYDPQLHDIDVIVR